MSDYKDTIFLPATDFSMRGNLSQKEPAMVQQWEEEGLYENLRRARADCPKFILHWGPPYANGNLHVGHAINGILKDLVTRSYSLLGYDAPLVPGWDCHGLPIEWKIEERYRKEGKRKEDVPLNDFRQECRAFAAEWQKIQATEFNRLGILSDMTNPYVTMDFSSEASIVKELMIFVEKGSVYKGVRPVMWSPLEKTVLADAEMEYQDKKSPAVYVSFKITKPSKSVLQGASCVIWTTTPWTLPGNRAIAYGAEIAYAVVEVSNVSEDSFVKVGQRFVIAQELVDVFLQTVGITTSTEIAVLKGSELQGSLCTHPFVEHGYEFEVPLVEGHHVTTDTGTGLVHTAPGHGPDDFEIGRKYGLEIADTINDNAVYTDAVKYFAGIHVFKADAPVVALLKEVGALVHETTLVHSYPHSWRSKGPLIFRTTPQWFISMEENGLRDKALAAIEKTQWIPEQGRNRILGMVKDRPDWCLSRQRAWGVPITLYTHKDTGEILRDTAVNERIIKTFQARGCDVWFEEDHSLFLSPTYDLADYIPCRDILDVWFESGATQGFVLEDRPDLGRPADMYLEGSDQHRGWFQSSLLLGCGTRGDAPFKTVVTHGFTMDSKGHKMSKSLGNTISPQDVANDMGAEILRLWVVSCDYKDDQRIGPEILKYQEDIYRRYRNTLRYLLGALNGHDLTAVVPYENLPDLEKWILHRLAEMQQAFEDCLKEIDFQGFYSKLHHFCSIDLSAFYLDIRKDTLYCDGIDHPKRQATLWVLKEIFERLVKWLMPVLPFTAQEAWNAYDAKAESIHLSLLPSIPATWRNQALVVPMEKIRAHRSTLTAALEVARKDGVIGSSLQAKVTVFDPHKTLIAGIDYAELAIVSQLEICSKASDKRGYTEGSLIVLVEKSTDKKCERCWKVLPDVGSHPDHPDACGRCADVVTSLKKKAS